MKSVILIALLALAACGSSNPPVPGEAQCRAEALQQPNVKAAITNSNTSSTNTLFNKGLQDPQEIARQTLQQATLDCMRRRGFATPGGVEPVKQYPFSSWGS